MVQLADKILVLRRQFAVDAHWAMDSPNPMPKNFIIETKLKNCLYLILFYKKEKYYLLYLYELCD